MRSSLLTASILTCLGLMSSSVSHASRTARTVEAPELVAGTWTSSQTGRGGSASVSIELASTSLVVPTVSTEADSTVVFTSETGRRTTATAGESIELDAGRYTMDVEVDGRDAATVGAYAAPLNDLTVQRHINASGETGATTIGVNPELISSEMIQAMIGGPAAAATIILTDARFRLMVEGTEASIMIEYTPETGEGRIGYGEPTYGGEGYGGMSPEDQTRNHGLDPQDLAGYRPDEIYTLPTDLLADRTADQLFDLIERMMDLFEEMESYGVHHGDAGSWIGGEVGGAFGGFMGLAAGPAGARWGATAGSTFGAWLGNELQDAVESGTRDDDGDGVQNRFDMDQDGDGIPNSRDSDKDDDGVPNKDDRYPFDNTKSIWAQSEGGVLMLSDSPVADVADIGDVDRTFDIQVEVILDDLDALEDFGAMVDGRY